MQGPNQFDRLPRDVIIYMALTMELPELYKYCRLSTRFNQAVCNNPQFWENRLESTYGITKDMIRYSPRYGSNPKEYYEILRKMLLEAGDDLSKKLETAAQYGIFDLVVDILKSGENLDIDGAVVNALMTKRFDIAKYILEKSKNLDGKMLGFFLLWANNAEFAKYLIDKGADLKYNHMAMGHVGGSIVSIGDVDLLKYAMSKGLKIGFVYLPTAVHTGNLDMIKFILDNVPDDGVRSLYSQSLALIAASKMGSLDILKYLLDTGAISEEALRGWARSLGRVTIRKMSPDIREYLLQKRLIRVN